MKNSSTATFECGGWRIGDLLSVASSDFTQYSARLRLRALSLLGTDAKIRSGSHCNGVTFRRSELEAQAEKSDVSLIRPFPAIAEEN